MYVRTLLVCVVGMTGVLFADVSVEDVKCTQRYPWNGLVDIEYTIACDDPEAEIYVNPVGFNGDTGLTVFPTHFTGDGATNTVKAGKHTMVWDAKADMGNLFSAKNFQIKMYAGKKLSRYIVIDISGGTEAETYPIRHSIEGPNLADDTCRTTEIWMRLIPPGTFMMGSPEDELGRATNAGETLCKVHITQPFYLGVFEVTEAQFVNVFGGGGTPSTSPKCAISIASIWRNCTGSGGPPSTMESDEGSFLRMLRERTKKYGFCLPSEAQWEYACRAGTATALYDGHNLSSVNGDDNLSKIARYAVNGNGHAKVGSYEPNALGLYDMLGNVSEWCRDWFSMYPSRSSELTDPLGLRYDDGNKYYHVVKGGNSGDLAVWCRAAGRRGVYFSSYDASWLGFRLCATADLQ